MRQFHSSDATNLAASAKNSGKRVKKKQVFIKLKSFLKLAQELLNYFERLTTVSQEKTKWQ
jgi:hypothetical protein